jgi:two-component system response regulator MprA
MENETILIIEEDDALLELLRRSLARNGFEVLAAQNGLSALTVPAEKQVDLVLLDQKLSVMDGAQIAERLRRGTSTYYLPVLLMVPAPFAAEGENQDLHGADGYMVIPADSDEIARKVRNMLEEKALHDRARKLLIERISKDIDHLVEGVVRDTFQDRAESTLSELSKGLVDLLEGRAREALRSMVDEVVEEEFTTRINALVEEGSRPIVEEVSNEIVTRIASDALDDRSQELVLRLERQQLPELAADAIEKASESARQEMIETVKEEVRGILVEDLCQNLPSLVEKMVSRAIPPATEKWVPEILDRQVAERVEKELAGKGSELVRKQVLGELRELGRKKLTRLFIFGLAASVLVLSAVMLAIMRFAPQLLDSMPSG